MKNPQLMAHNWLISRSVWLVSCPKRANVPSPFLRPGIDLHQYLEKPRPKGVEIWDRVTQGPLAPYDNPMLAFLFPKLFGPQVYGNVQR